MERFFEFVGGCRDGERFEGILANPFYWESDYGTIGTRFTVLSDYTTEQLMTGRSGGVGHVYEVVDRRDVDATVFVRAKYVGLRDAEAED